MNKQLTRNINTKTSNIKPQKTKCNNYNMQESKLKKNDFQQQRALQLINRLAFLLSVVNKNL